MEFTENKKYLDFILSKKKEADLIYDKIAQVESDKQFEKIQAVWIREENERILRKGKATSLSKTCELMKLYKEFLGEWEAEWTMGTEKARSLQTERKLKETDKEET